MQHSACEVRVIFHSAEQAAAFDRSLTGNDSDICLTIENAVNDVVDPDEVLADAAGERIWIEPV